MSAGDERPSDPVVHLLETCSLVGKRYRPVDLNKHFQVVKDVSSFRGVPFAQPPVGDLMFKEPQEVQLWSGLRTAHEFAPCCYQDFDILKYTPFEVNEKPNGMSEDCLYLNIWTPADLQDQKPAGTPDRQGLLPVMVWIHGGGFTSGFTDFYRGDVLSGVYDVVFVSIAYRVGIWGFLCTGDDVSKGNYGLLDQIEALRWVRKYISKFGGDPDNVTIFGESAGGASVSYLIQSPLARGLFKQAISQSGTSLTFGEMMTSQKAAHNLQTLLKHLGCTAGSSEEIVEFLKAQPPEKLIMPPLLSAAVALQPVIDGYCLTEPTEKYYLGKDCPKINYLLGINSSDSALILRMLAMYQNLDLTTLTRDSASTFLPIILGGRTENQQVVTSLSDAVAKEYLNDVTDSESVYKRLVEFLTDVIFTLPTVRIANYQTAHAPVHLYQLDIRPTFDKINPPWVRADHAVDLIYMFGAGFTHPDLVQLSSEEFRLSKTMMKYWTNFARTGNPNSDDLVEWLPYDAERKSYLNLGSTVTQEFDLRPERVRFWTQTLPLILQAQVPPEQQHQ